ncbi:MAG TPA: LptF/LptG family permease, partial [Pyrinomonadaceae bacterium]|nr:LptF/LptG family permease [Pyrinomonadaceae bacterium]
SSKSNFSFRSNGENSSHPSGEKRRLVSTQGRGHLVVATPDSGDFAASYVAATEGLISLVDVEQVPPKRASDNAQSEASFAAFETKSPSPSIASSLRTAAASDNAQVVQNLTVYEFGGSGSRLSAIYTVPRAAWEKDRIVFLSNATKVELNAGRPVTTDIADGELVDDSNPFAETVKKPSYLTITETKDQIENSESEIEQRTFAVALEKKYSTLFLPFIIALFTAPFALSLSRKGKVMTVGYAVGLWLLFMGITNVFEQFGLNGFLAPALAVWTPLMLFAMLGIYLLSKVKT